MNHRASVLIALLLAACASVPRPEASEYIKTLGGGVLTDMNKHPGEAYVGVNFAWVKAPPAQAVLVAEFTNDRRPARLTTEVPVAPIDKTFVLKSPLFGCVVNNSQYIVTITLFADQTKSTVLGTHRQAVGFAATPNIIQQMKLRQCDA